MTQPGPYGIPLFLVGVIVLVAFVVVLQTRDAEEDQPLEIRAQAGGAPSMVSAYGLIAFMAGVRFLQVAGIGVAMTFFNVYMDSAMGLPTAQIGFIAATARLVAVPVALLGPSLSRRMGFGATAVFASACAGLAMLPIAFGGIGRRRRAGLCRRDVVYLDALPCLLCLHDGAHARAPALDHERRQRNGRRPELRHHFAGRRLCYRQAGLPCCVCIGRSNHAAGHTDLCAVCAVRRTDR